jgi:hypothetical protein
MKRISGHAVTSFFVAAAVSFVPAAHASSLHTYNPSICEPDNNDVAPYLTNGALQNRDSVSHHYYCPMVEDSDLDLSQSGVSLTAYVDANAYSAYSIEVRTCRVPNGLAGQGTTTVCGSYAQLSSGWKNMAVNVGTAWTGGNTGDSYYVDMILYPEYGGAYNTVYSLYAVN